MELWIRSQDKEWLTKVEDLTLDNFETCYWICTKNHCLGKYKTKERALEVLDEIQNILLLKDMYKYERELVLKSWENVDGEQVQSVRQLMSVYKMPKE